MGHIRLGILPKNPKWKSLINELKAPDVNTDQLSDAVLLGANEILQTDSTKSCVSYSVWLLAQLVLASKSDDFAGNLQKIGVFIRSDTTTLEFLSNVSQVSNRHFSKIIPRTAINNIANIAIREALTQTVSSRSNTLFGTGAEDIQSALRQYSSQKQFGNLLHIYFSIFLRRILRLVVDKEIANHIGPDKSFDNLQAINQFDEKLSSFSSQTAKIVDTFSSGWYSKKVWQEGTISSEEAHKFVYVALRKLRNDLNISGGAIMKKNIVLCAGENLSEPAQRDSEVILANPYKPNPNIRYGIDNVSHRLLKSLNGLARDLLDIATYIYHADNSVKRGTNKDVFDEQWSRDFKFIIPVRNPEIWESDPVCNILVELMEYLTEDSYEFEFSKRTDGEEQLVFRGLSDKLPYGGGADCVLLFSGGMDSLAGVIDYYFQGRKPILASHQSRHDLAHSQRKLAAEIRQRLDGWSFPHIDIQINRIGSESEETSQRSRSFLYLSFGALVAYELGLKEVVVAENGVTTFNLPRLGQTYGAHASRSTHPKVISLFEQLLHTALSADIRITTPLLWNTRVDNIRILEKHGCINLLPLSASCNHSRRPSIYPHCGTCSQCVDRRFAVEYLHLHDLDGEITGYEKDIFTESMRLGEETMQVISPVLFLMDYRKRNIDSFLKEYGIVYDALDYLKGDYEENAQKIYELYGRFADSIEAVMAQKTSENWFKIINNDLPESCLLMRCQDKKSLQSPSNIRQRASELIERIRICPFTENKVYEDLCEEVLTFLFVENVLHPFALEKPYSQMNNNGGFQRRDLVFENGATEGFWFAVRQDYHATGVIVDAKNYKDEIDGAVIIDFAGKYLKQKGLGLFGIVIARKIPLSVKSLDAKQRLSGIVKAQEELWRNDSKMVVVLDDADLIAMLESKIKLGDPTDLVQNRIFALKAGI